MHKGSTGNYGDILPISGRITEILQRHLRHKDHERRTQKIINRIILLMPEYLMHRGYHLIHSLALPYGIRLIWNIFPFSMADIHQNSTLFLRIGNIRSIYTDYVRIDMGLVYGPSIIIECRHQLIVVRIIFQSLLYTYRKDLVHQFTETELFEQFSCIWGT